MIPRRKALRTCDTTSPRFTPESRGHERAVLLIRTEKIRPVIGKVELQLPRISLERAAFTSVKKVVQQQNEDLLDLWHELPRRVQNQVWLHLRHYVHSTLEVSWLDDTTPEFSTLKAISWREPPVSISLKKPVGVLSPDSTTSETINVLVDRLSAAIGELGYEAVVEDLLSPDLLGGEDSVLPSQEIMVVPGHLADTSRSILLAVTRGWRGKEPLSFGKVMVQVKTRLIEANGTIKVVVVFCDSWDSASFQEEYRDELRAHDQNGVRFLFMMVGVPDRVLVPIPVEFDRAGR